MVIPAFLCCILGSTPETDLFELYKDPRTYKYNKATLTPVFESSFWNGNRLTTQLFKLGANPNSSLDRTGSANNENPWLHTGGIDKVRNSVIKRMLWVPEGKKIKLYRETKRNLRRADGGIHDNKSRIAGVYPIGTVSAEFMYEGDRLYEVRSRKKTAADNWETAREHYGEKPAGYVEVNNCIDCHKDIGKSSFEVADRFGRTNRDWYGTVRGLEKDGPIHWHPFAVPKNFRSISQIRIREDVKDLVEWAE